MNFEFVCSFTGLIGCITLLCKQLETVIQILGEICHVLKKIFHHLKIFFQKILTYFLREKEFKETTYRKTRTRTILPSQKRELPPRKRKKTQFYGIDN